MAIGYTVLWLQVDLDKSRNLPRCVNVLATVVILLFAAL